MVVLGIVADDLTGANDTGLQFSKVGLKTAVIWDLEGLMETASTADVVVVDTESRKASAEVAHRKVFEAARRLKETGAKLFYKKVDSTLRGNIGSELDGMMDALGAPVALVAPAFPRNRRITVGGHQLVNSLPLEHTEIRRDAATPVKTSHVPTVIGGQSRRRIYQISLGDVMQGAEPIKERIELERRRGIEILVFDATTQEELRAIARAAALLDEPPILCGSAGLAEEIPYVFNLQPARRGVLIIVGTLSAVTARQVETLERTTQTSVVEIKPEHMLGDDERWAMEIKRVCSEATKNLDEGRNVAIRWAGSSREAENAKQSLEKGGRNDRSSIILSTLGGIARSFVDGDLAGLVLTGGDTAMSVMRAFEAEGVRVIGEVEPGVPIVTSVGGRSEGVKIVTKAGAFGDDQTLVRAVQRLRWEG